MPAAKPNVRCPWSLKGNDLYVDYHDREWGVPQHDDRALFEMLVLEGFQAGLAWITILRKREGFRRAFDGFDPAKMARYTPARVERMLGDPGIVRHRGKVEASILSARAWLDVMDEGPGFSKLLWDFVDGRPIVNQWDDYRQAPATSRESDAMSKALKARGCKFVGSTICYAFMQATGMVDDHQRDCWRKKAAR